MLRLSEIKLPLDHTESALREAILNRLSIDDNALQSWTIAKRSHDARKKPNIIFLYSVDIELVGGEAAEQALL